MHLETRKLMHETQNWTKLCHQWGKTENCGTKKGKPK